MAAGRLPPHPKHFSVSYPLAKNEYFLLKKPRRKQLELVIDTIILIIFTGFANIYTYMYQYAISNDS